MLRKLSKRIYTAEATVKGVRQGHARTSDGVLDLEVRLPIEMGGKGVPRIRSSSSVLVTARVSKARLIWRAGASVLIPADQR
jgi:hypothetical protein